MFFYLNPYSNSNKSSGQIKNSTTTGEAKPYDAKTIVTKAVATNNKKSLTPLLKAIYCNNLSNTIELLKGGANPNLPYCYYNDGLLSIRRYPLHLALDPSTASNTDKREIIKALLQHDADINKPDENNKSPLDYYVKQCVGCNNYKYGHKIHELFEIKLGRVIDIKREETCLNVTGSTSLSEYRNNTLKNPLSPQ